MVNQNLVPENPLRRWRKGRGWTVAQCIEALGDNFKASTWYQWEAWPHGGTVRYPGPDAWVHIRALTDDAVTPNDFSDLVREAA